jgi:hypothetical protein
MSAADQSSQFKLSFTAIALGLREAEAMLGLWRHERDWDGVGEAAVEGNIFQKSSSASTRRIFRELRQRLEFLDPQTLEQFDQVSTDEQRAILLIAACKCYPFLFDFIHSTLADKLAVFDYAVSTEDFDLYWNRTEIDHPELEDIADSTRKKIRQVTFRLLTEAGLFSSTRQPQMTPIHISPAIEAVLLREGAIYRQAFLIT